MAYLSKEELKKISDFYKNNTGLHKVVCECKIPRCQWNKASIYVDLSMVTPDTTKKELHDVIFEAAKEQIDEEVQVKVMNVYNETISKEFFERVKIAAKPL